MQYFNRNFHTTSKRLSTCSALENGFDACLICIGVNIHVLWKIFTLFLLRLLAYGMELAHVKLYDCYSVCCKSTPNHTHMLVVANQIEFSVR